MEDVIYSCTVCTAYKPIHILCSGSTFSRDLLMLVYLELLSLEMLSRNTIKYYILGHVLFVLLYMQLAQ